ncbi:hypothetical protein BJ742DRAFT_834611 [Cladochytrium replicatum]|nr:hypothetical protein BJ742DRAFT_834611 [Cladochytrium replicatum]
MVAASNGSRPQADAVALPSKPVPAMTSSDEELHAHHGPIVGRVLAMHHALILTDGRDKMFKLTQFSARMILWSAATLRPQLQQFLESYGKDVEVPDLPVPLQKRLNSIVAAMSLTRKVIRTFHWLEPIEKMVEVDPAVYPDDRVRHNMLVINHIVGTACNVADDINCLAKIGVLSSKTGKLWGPRASQLWFTCIWLDLYENTMSFLDVYTLKKTALRRNLRKAESPVPLHKRQPTTMSVLLPSKSSTGTVQQLDTRLRAIYTIYFKLLMDLIYCSYDVFHLEGKGWDQGWQVWTGLISAWIGAHKLYGKLRDRMFN